MEPELEIVKNYGSPKTIRYKTFFYINALGGLLRTNRVINSRKRHGVDSNFRFSPAAKRAWYQLYDAPLEADIPFTVYSHAGAVAVMIILEGLKANFKYLMHLKNEMWVHRPLQPGTTYEIYYKFEEVKRIKHDKVALVGTSLIRKDGEVYYEMRDQFVIKNVPVKNADLLRMDETGEFRGITRLSADPIANSKIKKIWIPENMPRRYAKVSGDYNMIHTIPLIANFFGYDRVFIQGLCASNIIIKELSLAGIDLNYYSIIFCLPVFTGQNVYLHYNDHEYRLQDEEGRILCYGKINNNTKGPFK